MRSVGSESRASASLAWAGYTRCRHAHSLGPISSAARMCSQVKHCAIVLVQRHDRGGADRPHRSTPVRLAQPRSDT